MKRLVHSSRNSSIRCRTTRISSSVGAWLPALAMVLFCTAPGHAVSGLTAHAGATISVGSGYSAPVAVVLDPSGDVFVGDTATGSVTEIVATGGVVSPSSQVTTIATGFNRLEALAIDSSGNIYVTTQTNGALYEIVATNGTVSPASLVRTINSSFSAPIGVAVDKRGNVFVADGQAVKEVTATGGSVSSSSPVTTVASGFQTAFGLGFDRSGNLYVTDSVANKLYVLLAVNGAVSSGSTRTLISSAFNGPVSAAADLRGNVFVGDSLNNAVKEVVAINGMVSSASAVLTLGTPINAPVGVALDAGGDVFVAHVNSPGGTSEILASAQRLTTTAVGSTSPAQRLYFTIDSAGTLGATPYTVLTDGAANLDFKAAGTQAATACITGHNYAAGDVCTVDVTIGPTVPGVRHGAVRLLGTGGPAATALLSGTGTGPLAQFIPGTLALVAGGGGNGVESGDNVPATSANIGPSFAIKADSFGNFYFADQFNHVVRKVTASTGTISTVAGIAGTCGSTGDGGPAVSAALCGPQGLALDGAGNIYISDTLNDTVRRIDAATGIISTIAGAPGARGYSGDGGPATGARLYYPLGIAVDTAGNVYVGERANYVVRRIDAATGIITTFAGIGTTGLSGDGGLATAAQMGVPEDVALDSSGNLYIADNTNRSVRVVDALTGIITTYAGGPNNSNHNDGVAAITADIGGPQGLAIDAADNLNILGGSTRVDRVERATGLLRFVAGNGQTGKFNVDGVPATSTSIGEATAIALDGQGSLYIADAGYYRILKINPASPSFIYPTPTKAGTTDTADGAMSVLFSNIGNAPLTFNPPASGANPSLSPSWKLDTSNTCPSVAAGSTALSLASGAECLLAIDFAPVTAGALTGTATLMDNSLNATSTQVVALAGQGTGATLTISPTSQVFAATPSGGTSAMLTSSITNSAAQAVSLSAGTLTDAADFTSTNNCGGTVGGNATCIVSFVFTPKSIGPLSSTYSIADASNPGSPLTVALSGNGTAPLVPQATLSPTSLTFTTVANTQAYNQTISLSNPGTAALSISSVALGGANTAAYSIITNGCGASLAPGSSCNIVVDCTTVTVGTYNATLVVNDNATPPTQTATLSCNVTGVPQATLSPTSLAFTTAVGATAPNQNLTLSNPGTAALSITSVALSGTNAASFGIAANACGTSMAAGSSCTISIGCSATTLGSYAATLTVTDNAANTTQTAALSCTVNGTPQATITPATYTFGSVNSGTTTAPATITVSNPGTAPLAITSISLTGANATSFAMANNGCGSTLAASASCIVNVTFTPSGAGSFSAALTVTDSVGTQSASLSGTGVTVSPADFSLTATPASQSSYRGQGVSYTIQLASALTSSPFTNTVALTVSNLPGGATATFTPPSVTPGAGGGNSTLTINVPQLAATNHGPRGPRTGPLGLSLAALAMVWTLRRKRLHRTLRLLSLLLALAAGAALTAITGCGNGNGFAVPTSTTTITVIGTSGSTVHSTQVQLTIQ